MSGAERAPHEPVVRVHAGEALAVLAIGVVWALVVRPGPLSLPYFWDEADVYAPGARWLADHDLDPTPGHFPDDWSRGHPPLLYVVAALAFRAFGPGPTVGHALIVPFTALAIAATYALGAERAGRAVGVGAAALLATSPLFLSMGAFLLPEMPLTALTILALFLFSRGNVVGAAACGVALVWIKETGVGPPIAIAGGLVFEAWRRGRLRAAAVPIAISLVPVVALAAFFVWQRATAGYFVFPHHQNLFGERPLGIENAITVFPSLLAWHGRWVAVGVAMVAVIVMIVRRAWPASLRADGTNVAIVLLVLGNVVFFAKMFWLERYALPVHPGVCVLVAIAIAEGAKLLPEPARALGAAAPLAIASTIGLFSLRDPSGAPEHTFAFADVVETHRDAIARINAESEGEPRVVTVWPLTTEMREPWLGFVDAPMRSVHPDHLGDHPDWHVDLVLVDTSSRQRDRLRELARSAGMRERWSVQRGSAPALELWGP